MKHKWKMFWIFIGLYTCGVIGFAWHTYSASVLLQQTQPTIVPTLEAIKMVFVMLGGLGVIAATYFNVINSIEASKSAEHRLMFDINENTYRLIQDWDAPALLEARRYSRELKAKRRDLSTNDLIKEIEANPKLKESLVLLLNYFEQMRISVNTKRIDSRLLADSMNLIFFDILERYKPYISEKCRRSFWPIYWI
jgi:hypothetical protein